MNIFYRSIYIISKLLRLVRDTAKALAPMKTSQTSQTGMLCLISDDSDFRQILLDVHHSGWSRSVCCNEGSFVLRKRADRWPLGAFQGF